jgi:hypothetical protein
MSKDAGEAGVFSVPARSDMRTGRTTEEVLDKGTDISGKVLRYLVAISHY